MSQKDQIQNARNRLAALREKAPDSKAAQVRALWPDISAALEKGHGLKTICDCLAAGGVIMTVQTLGSYVTRMRRNPALREARDRLDRISSERPQHAPTVIPVDPQRAKDPLANVRQRLGKRAGFDYRPELADPKKLI